MTSGRVLPPILQAVSSMAPTRPRPQVAAPQGLKKVHRKPRTQREPSDSWELLDRHELDANADDDVEGLGQSMRIRNPADVDEAMNPLREMADRIGKEVETFAVTLDTYLFSRKDRESSIFGPAHDVVVAFKAIAEEKVHEIKRGHEQEVRAQLKKEWSEQAPVPAASLALAPFTSTGLGSLTTRQAEQVKQLRQWQQEADIWELFRILLELHPSEAKARAARAGHNEKRLKDMGPPHRYVSESDLWERFIIENDLARERYMIKTWLEQTADHQISDVQGIVEELEAKAGRGKGLWSSGWMHTREKIKGEKRLRTWPSAEDSPQPQIRRSDNTELLITTLDPDAPARQSRTLEKPDAYFERAIWVACWEMLRRGSSLEDISAWCEERREGWRALIMGAGLDDTKSASSNVLWRRMCLLASRSGTVTDHEAAVLGQIGGNVKAMERVAYSLDDHLYAHYSAALTQQFDQYLLATNPAKARHSTSRRNLLEDFAFDPEHAQRAINDLITRLRKNASTSSESAQPMKIIQSFLLENEVARLIHTVGAAIAETAALQGPEDMIYLRDREASNGGTPRGEAEVAFNPQTLRIVAHMAIVHRFSSPNTLHGDELLEDENVLVAYIQALRQARKWSLIPNYAAKLQRQRYILVMGRVLQDVRDAGERTEILELLEANQMDIVSILQEQLAWHLDMAFPSQYAEKPLTILEPAPPEKAIYPGYRINEKFLPTGAVEGDDAVIRALEWFLLLKGGWEVTFKALAIALRKCLGKSLMGMKKVALLTRTSHWAPRMRGQDCECLPIRQSLSGQSTADNGRQN